MTYSVHDGLIWKGDKDVGLPEADYIAQANGFTYAERFVRAFDGKTIELDGDLKLKVVYDTARHER